MRLSAEESIEDVSQIVCACLGELGAIDPARVSISLFDDRAARSAALTSSSYSASVSTSSTPSSAPLLAPWHTNDSKMALELLEHMLVPKLRAATADKDRCGTKENRGEGRHKVGLEGCVDLQMVQGV